MWILSKASPRIGIASALVLTGCGGSSGTPDPSTDLGTSSPAAPGVAAGAAAAMVVVNEAYAAFNFGDVARWVAGREPGSYYASDVQRKVAREESTRWTESQVAAGAQFTGIQCTYQGEGVWPGIADGGMPTAEGHYVTCDAVLVPESVEGGGKMTFKWVIAHDEVVAVTSGGSEGWCIGLGNDSQANAAVPALPLNWRPGVTLQTGFTHTR